MPFDTWVLDAALDQRRADDEQHRQKVLAKMNVVRLKVLEAEVKAQWAGIQQVYTELEDRAGQMRPNQPAQVESTAYQLHNLYSAVEDLFKIVAGAFENSVADLSRWDTELLRRMTLNIDGVRPALLSPQSADLLHELRAFRHFFRHAYGQRLDFDRVEQNLVIARQLLPLLANDVASFLRALGLSDEAKAQPQ